MNAPVYNWNGEKIGDVDLPDAIFKERWNADLVHQVLSVQQANRRQSLAHTKGRGEVRGGGRKPWRQKGTGRARHGSTRSPIWVGGGVAHGPTNEKKFGKEINTKMVRGAIHSVLSRKLHDGELRVIDALPRVAKAKEVAGGLKAFPSVLLVSSAEGKMIGRAVRNIPRVSAIGTHALNVYDLLRYKHIMIERAAISSIR